MNELTADQVLDGIKVWAGRVFIVAGLKVETALHGGRFTPAELERYATRTLACRIALEGLKFETNGRGQLEATAHVVVVALAGDLGQAGSRASNVLTVTAALQAALPGSRCGLELMDSVNAKDMRAANLYHAELEKRNTAAWVLTWPVKFLHPRVR
ncbi:hypothetical protein [Pseudomonas citronellolis]|uniref:hypothetical protein n=1 Tax=Pseudomonas citronellolis TaxID=53408 RepID=UPI000778CBBB|nr:hypothetical protein [Pseudomonas citronellolis]AMO73846.1 hypothetical protein PcP3B5_03340 [Pseudomonas citronellolis]